MPKVLIGNIKGPKGDTGTSVTHKWNGTKLEITSESGTSSADLKGDQGEKGNKGDPGVSCTHEWEGTRLTVTSASGTSSVDLADALVQPDFAQNDDTQKDYVKNRTHWVERDISTVATNKRTLSFSVVTPRPTFNFFIVADAGRSFLVTWNGVDYEAVSTDGNNGDIYLGDYSLVNNTYPATDYPFCLVWKSGSKAVTAYNSAYSGSALNATVYVEQIGELIYHKLDKNFLPDDIGGGSGGSEFYVETETVEPLPETTIELEEGEGAIAAIDLVEGATYTVVWNGTEYKCTCVKIDDDNAVYYSLGNMSIFGGNDSGEPFIILSMPAGGISVVLDFAGGDTAIVSVNGEVEIVHGLDGKFLPDGTPYSEKFDDVIAENLTFDENGRSQDAVGNVVVGNTYNVIFNGVVYPCVARHENSVTVWLGDYTGKFEDMPFILELAPGSLANYVGYTAKISTDEEVNSVSIVGGVSHCKIDRRCMDVFEPVVVDFLGDSKTCSMSFYKLRKLACTEGKAIFARYTDSGASAANSNYEMLYTLTNAGVGEITFSRLEIGSSNNVRVDLIRFNDSNTFTRSSIALGGS